MEHSVAGNGGTAHAVSAAGQREEGGQLASASVCEIEGCDNTNIAARGMCWKHYRRYLRHGNPLTALNIHEHPDTCSLDDCDRPYYARGFCETHYKRLRIVGDPRKVRSSQKWDGTIPSLMDYVDIDRETDCYMWQPRTGNGPSIHSPRVFHQGKTEYVHRIVADLVYGIGDDDVIHRRCHRKECVNPNHMVVTKRGGS